MQLVLTPDVEYVPIAQFVQPSFEDVAASKVEYLPVGHSWLLQLVFEPEPEYLPTPQSVQPSELVIAFILDDY